MNKQRKQHLDIYDENVFANPTSGKSPIQRNIYHQYNNIRKSPIRSRTPNKPVSPAKAYHQMPHNIRYIANVSPLKERSNQVENYIQLSNGKNVRYIHGHKMQRNYQTTKKNQYKMHSDRVFQQQNRLFGKLVDKLNSEKKVPPRSNQVSNKTSFYTQNSDIKPNKVDPSLRPSGTFKHLISQVKIGQTKSQIKPHSKGNEFDLPNEGEPENLSCLVYRVKNIIDESNIVQKSNNSQINNHYSSIIRKKPSKAECLPEYKDQFVKNNNVLIEQQDEYKQLDILLGKIQQGKGKQALNANEEYLVKMSLLVKESLSMDPFI